METQDASRPSDRQVQATLAETWDALRPCDRQVQAALAAGDIRQALRILVEGYNKYVLQYCRAFLGHKADGEDVAQDTFIAIHAALPRYRPECLLRAWVFQIARYKCLRYQRKLWNRLRILKARGPDIIKSVMAGPPLPPEVELMTSPQIRLEQLLLDQLEPSLCRLPRYDRELLMMRYWEGLSIRAMAKQLRRSPTTMGRAVHAAETRLLARMTKEQQVNGVDVITPEVVG